MVRQIEKLITNHLLCNVSLLLQLVPNHYLIPLTLTFYSDNNCNYLEHIDQSCNKITLLGWNVSTNCNYAMFLASSVKLTAMLALITIRQWIASLIR